MTNQTSQTPTKYLSDYTDNKVSALLKSTGSFYAFSMEQFIEQKVEGVKYIQNGSGLLYPKKYASKVTKGIQKIFSEGIEEDIKENGIPAIIARELSNHECFYTMNPTDAFDSLDMYGISNEDIWKVFEDLKNDPRYIQH